MLKKRILSLILMFCFISFSCIVFAQTEEVFIADGITFSSNVYVQGKTTPARNVTLMITGNNKILYIEEIIADENGVYQLKFPFRGNPDECTLRIRDGETVQDLTDSIQKVEAMDSSICVTLEVKNADDGKKYADAGDKLDVFANVLNKYCEAGKFSLIMAAYDESGKLTGAKMNECSVGYELNQSLEADFSSYALPDETEFVKVYVLEGLKSMMPLGISGAIGKSVNLHLVSHSQCASYTDYYYPRMGWGQFIGDMLAENVTVKNWAREGWSLKAFLVSGPSPVKGDLTSCNQPENSVWKTQIMPEIQSGDYVLISHGINDYFQGSYDITDENGEVVFSWKQSSSEFKESLRTVIQDVRSKGATPILATDTSAVGENLYSQVAEYNQAIEEVAQEESVSFLDILTPYRNAYLNMGIQEFKDTYNLTQNSLEWYKQYDRIGKGFSDVISSTNDGTHYCKRGAELVAGIIANKIATSDSTLKKYVIKY